ncbi:hypothetical protein, partial [Aeromonas sp. Prich7-2]|uniref:hypothetical protein n=1 Tax=Aeromonas sp. Prich7-2 TaxID=2823361 RepID=UPI001B32F4F9
SVFFGLAPLQTCSLTIWKADLKSSSQTFVTSALETSWRKPNFIWSLLYDNKPCRFHRHFLGLYG